MAVCNGLETLLVHRDAAASSLPLVLKALHEEGVEIRGDEAPRAVFGDAKPAEASDWTEEYLAPILAVRVVDDLDAADDPARVVKLGDRFLYRTDVARVGVRARRFGDVDFSGWVVTGRAVFDGATFEGAAKFGSGPSSAQTLTGHSESVSAVAVATTMIS